MSEDDNEPPKRFQLRHVETKRQEVTVPPEVLEQAKKAREESSDLAFSADQHAIIFVCQRGRQSLFDIARGVNSTRIPIGKKPLDEKKILSIVKKLESEGFLVKGELGSRAVWTTTPKSRELEL